MGEVAMPAVFMRGGTSRALFFHQHDLPSADPPRSCEAWDPIFLSALGSPDRHGRQLNGMGGGLSSLSKIAVVGPSRRTDADVDYTFAQVAIREPVVGYKGNCGNISSAVGPFAVDEGLVAASGDSATVRIHNTNTGKVIAATFPLFGGKAAVDGDYRLDGVAGTGAPISLAFLDPGGSTTGALLPTGNVRDVIDIASFGQVEVSLVDAANPAVFVAAASLGLSGGEEPDELARPDRASLFEDIRVAAAVRMGLVAVEDDARGRMKSLPLVAIVCPPMDPAMADIQTRMISSGQPHRATPLTGAMCLAIAAQVPGSLAHAARTGGENSHDVRISHPAGTMTVAARVVAEDGRPVAREAVVTRTARRLMEGRVIVQA